MKAPTVPVAGKLVEPLGSTARTDVRVGVRARRSARSAAAARQLAQARRAFDRHDWADACRFFQLADGSSPLTAGELERLALAGYLIGRDDIYLGALERAHRAHLQAGRPCPAIRCAFWIGLRLLFRGDAAQGSGWLARAERLLESEGDCVERGYLLLPRVEQRLGARDADAAWRVASRAVEIGERFSEADLVACARHLQGRVLLQQRRLCDGLALLDEAMVAVTGGELSPLVTGLVYCSVIDACRQVYEWRRAHEWTEALAHWCERQPQLVSFTETCLVHRAEISQWHGAWQDAVEQARRACERADCGADRRPPAEAFYRQAEIFRLRGDFPAAEEAYRNASRSGRDPQPGLALLRHAQGRADEALAALRRALGAADDPLHRAALLDPFIECALALGQIDEASRAVDELKSTAAGLESPVLQAMFARAEGEQALTEGKAELALAPLRRAFDSWQQVDAPYELARVRVLLARACRMLGDDEGARLEAAAAAAVFERLGAVPDLEALRMLVAELKGPGCVANRPGRGAQWPGGGEGPRPVDPERPAGLTPRELQVLRLVATGKTNKSIAGELSVSERTIDRHLANIFDKLGVSSRAAATAWACRHRLA